MKQDQERDDANLYKIHTFKNAHMWYGYTHEHTMLHSIQLKYGLDWLTINESLVVDGHG